MLGYAGKILMVNLTNGKTEIRKLDPEVLRMCLGGRALGAQLLYELCPVNISPFDPAVPFMVLTGPVSGTPTLGSSKHVVVTKSVATGGWLDSYSSGHMAAHLKYAGWDGIIITGRSPKPCCLIVEDDRATLQEASHLWGQDAFETERWLRQNVFAHGGHMAIGPAGENLVKFACINSEFFRQTGRGGAGAGMGSKNLKAIAVKGTGGIRLADPRGLMEAFLKILKDLKASPKAQNFAKLGTFMVVDVVNEAGILPTLNFQKGTFPEGVGRIDKDGLFQVKVADQACASCAMPCGNLVEVKQGPHAGARLEGPEYETLCLLGSNIGIRDLDTIIKANVLCDQLGLDTMSMGNVLGFAMECYQKGLLTKERTGGFDLHFGNAEAVLKLIEMTARREGFGDQLARGVKELAAAIGQGSEKLAMHAKGLEMPAYEPRGVFGAALTFSVNPRGACHRRAWPPAKEILGGVPPYTVEGKAPLIRGMFNDRCILHSLIVCDFHAGLVPVPMNYYAESVSKVTGEDFNLERLYWIAERTETLIRLFNYREGFSRKDDWLPERIVEGSLPDGPAKGQVIGKAGLNRMLDEYYALRGWDANGAPTPETLSKYQIHR